MLNQTGDQDNSYKLGLPRKTTMYRFTSYLASPIIMDLIQHDFTMDSSRPFDVQPLKTISLAGATAYVILCFLVTESLEFRSYLSPWDENVPLCIRTSGCRWQTQPELAYTRVTIKTAVAIIKQMIFTGKLLVPLAELKLKSQVSGNRKSK